MLAAPFEERELLNQSNQSPSPEAPRPSILPLEPQAKQEKTRERHVAKSQTENQRPVDGGAILDASIDEDDALLFCTLAIAFTFMAPFCLLYFSRLPALP